VKKDESMMEQGIAAAKKEDYLQAMNLLMDAYNGGEFSRKGAKSAEALSYYGLCLALIQKKYKQAVEFCLKAIDMNFYSPDHYANLALTYSAASMKKKAVETADKGLRLFPEDRNLTRVRKSFGVRSRPAVPFLRRESEINKSLGFSRHARKGPKKPAK